MTTEQKLDLAVKALRDIREGYQQMFDVMPVAWQTFDNIAESALDQIEGFQVGKVYPANINGADGTVTFLSQECADAYSRQLKGDR